MALPPPLFSEGSPPPVLPYKNILNYTLRIAVAVGITFFLNQFKFDNIESFLYDLRLRFRPASQTSGQIEIIMIDNETISYFKGLPDAKEHAKMLQILSSAPNPPKAFIYTKAFAGFKSNTDNDDQSAYISGTYQEKVQFLNASKKLPNFYLQTDTLERAAEEKKLTLESPFESILVMSGPKTADRNILARDGVSRRALITYQDQFLLHPTIAVLFNPSIAKIENIRGRSVLFDSEQIYIDFHPLGSFPITKFESIFQGKVDVSRFSNKLVLIGYDIGASSKDYALTPLNKEPVMTNAELHANMFDTFIRNSAPQQQNNWINIIITFLVSLLTLLVVLKVRPTAGLFLLFGSAAGVSFVAWLLFWLFGIWIQLAHPLLAVFICSYFFIPYRLIIENRRSWEYYQKHKLLQQVEELKTNFISMMSHDLKTPIARIQGMTEMIAKDQTILSPTQQEALDTVKSSATDLLGVINSILNYAKIESQGVELHKSAKDVNELIKETIKRYEFLAKVKHVKIQTNFEPLFSISLDPELMKQVFSNLLENAIKYSEDHSVVEIQTMEKDGWICIEFVDRGQGISAEDIPHIFMKFFRSKHAKSSKVKGSGLGLYLAKYFVELHDGSIFVASSIGKGSTFSVKLPLRSL